MSVPVLTFFNNKGGVGKTSLVYHLSWMFASLGRRVLAVDLDAQANLTAAYFDEERIEELWRTDGDPTTIYEAIEPLTKVGDLVDPVLQNVTPNLHVIPGSVALAGFEEVLSQEWPNALSESNPYRAFRILTSFWQVAQNSAKRIDADLILVDVGPNLGAINRSALIASDHVIIPLGADLFSLQGLMNLGPTLRNWRRAWRKRVDAWSEPEFSLPSGGMAPIGYVVQQYGVRLSRPVRAYDRWINRIPSTYREQVLGEIPSGEPPAVKEDPHCIAMVKHYRSLVPLGQEARKPIFALAPADGAIGSHAQAVVEARKDFEALARRILERLPQKA